MQEWHTGGILIMELALRLLIAGVAGALFRMLQVFGTPFWLLALLFGVTGAVLSWQLVNARLGVVFVIAVGYFLTFRMTPALAPDTSVDNPILFFFQAIGNLSMPFMFPAIGSMIGMQIEEWRKPEPDKPLTEEDLLNEPIPTLDPVTVAYEELDGVNSHPGN